MTVFADMKRLCVLLSVLAAIYINVPAQQVAQYETMYLGHDNHVTLNIPGKLADRMVATPTSSNVSNNVADPQIEAEAKAQEPVATQSAAKTGGYRVQVYLDNNARTAKNEARARARNISEQFPHYPTYVVYSSPYWRLRVGNFRTHDEADEAAAAISAAFPSYAREIRVVKDRIVVTTD